MRLIQTCVFDQHVVVYLSTSIRVNERLTPFLLFKEVFLFFNEFIYNVDIMMIFYFHLLSLIKISTPEKILKIHNNSNSHKKYAV